MKKAIFGFLFVLLVQINLAAQNQSVTIVNNTGYQVLELYISHTSSNAWRQNRLNGNLNNGQSITISIPTQINNLHDIWLAGLGNRNYVRMDEPILANSTITITSRDSYPERPEGNDTTVYDGPQVTIVNSTGYSVLAVYAGSTSSDTRGRNRLASNQVLNDGERITVKLPRSAENRYDLVLVDLDGDSYSKSRIQVSPNSTIEFKIVDLVDR